MKPKSLCFKSVLQATHSAIALLLCVALATSADPLVFAAAQQPSSASDNATLPNDQLDSLVAPIALYPDPLLAQILAASTYPLEIVQLSQWMQKNSKLSADQAAAEVKKQDWDPSVQALVALPDVVKILYDNIKWTADLGNAFLAQQSAVMDAVQRMRAKAKSKGNLNTTEQQKVETQVIENKQVIVIQPAQPDVVYVPAYDPVVVYGPPVYPYYPYVYPPGYAWAGMALSFGVGMMVGAAWGGGWGWGCGWGGGDVTINRNNNFNRNSNINGGDRVNGGNRGNGGNRPSQQPSRGGGGDRWQHNPQHRGGAPYSNRDTANKYGGTARGDSQRGDRQQAGVSDRSSPGGRGGASAGTMDRGGGNRGASAGNTSRGGGTDRIGNQRTSPGSGSGSAFGSGGSSRSSARASSSRGSSSMGSRGGGGRSGGGRRR